MMKTLIALFFMFISLVSFSEIKKGSLAAFSMVNNSCNINKYTAKDYVQNGLISMLDGIENGGVGVHDTDAHIWTNLKDTGLSIGNSSMIFGEDYMMLGTTIYGNIMTSHEIEALGSECDYTVEFLVETGDTTWNTPMMLWDSLNRTSLISFMHVPKRIFYHNNVIIKSSIYMNIGETCLFTFVREGTKGYGYINGEFIGVKDIDNTYIGTRMYLYASAHKQKRIAIYNRPLTQEEISYNYSIDKSRFNL